MKRTLIRLQCLLLALLMTAGLFGCAKNTPSHGVTGGALSAAEADGERFVSVTLPLPDGYSMANCFSRSARSDPETGWISVPAESWDQEGGRSLGRKIFTFTRSGKLKSEIDIPGEERFQLDASAFAPGSFWYVLRQGSETRLCRMRLLDGELLADADFDSLPELPPDFRLYTMAVDGDGDLWLAGENTTLVYTSEFTFVSSVRAGPWVSSFAVDGDGEIWGCSNYGGNVGWGAARLSKQTGTYEDAIPLAENSRCIAFGTDGTLYYDGNNGIRCIRSDAQEKKTAHPLMSFLDSGVMWSTSRGANGEEHADLILAPDGDCLVFCRNERGNGGILYLPCICRRATDTAEAAGNTLPLAYTDVLAPNIRSEVVRFNREHADIQISLLDYSVYNNNMSPNGGARKLLIDILNGIVSPDIVLGAADSEVLTTLARKKLTADLMPHLEKDEKVNPSSVFGCVLRYFDDGEGGLWGIAPYFTLNTWISVPEILGSYGGAGGWSLEDFLDFAESLPEGRFVENGACLPYYMVKLVNEQFVDRETGTCSFDSPLYVRYLRFLENLPPQETFRKATSAYRDSFTPCREKVYSLAGTYLWGEGSMTELERYFGTRDYVFVGYPSEDPEWRAQMSAPYSFVVTKTCREPEAAWEFIRMTFHAPWDSSVDLWVSDPGMTSLKPYFDERVENLENQAMLHFADGRWVNTLTKPEEFELYREEIESCLSSELKGMPYTVEPYDKEQALRIREFLDTGGGSALHYLPTAVSDLIREEISAFLGGVGTAEDCAEKIQSRVSIWLEENK